MTTSRHTSTLCLVLLLLGGCRAYKKQETSEVRIVGGEFPHMNPDQRTMAHTVSLIARATPNSAMRCTGVVIGPHQVVTAAHCLVNAKQLDIGIGPRYWRLPGIQTTNIMRHPRWTKGYHYDVGIVTFSGDLPDKVKPVPIADKNNLKSGDTVLIAGYGSSGEVHPDLRGEFGFLRQVWVEVDLMEPETTTFTIKPYARKGGCHGDSGGPAFLDRGGKLELIGLISGPSTDAPCDEGHGTLTQIAKYQGWLKCAFQLAQNPLDTLADDESSVDCPASKG
ncbi:MAG: trypsin-like serine protease [Deltaproteobacteria bacterium]|nr:trypsin-like serine protease [Deltaproteobacteria bacterium]